MNRLRPPERPKKLNTSKPEQKRHLDPPAQSHRRGVLTLWLLREQQRELESQPPGRCTGRVHGIAIELDRITNRLKPHARAPSDAAAKGQSPPSSWRRIIAAGCIARSLVFPIG